MSRRTILALAVLLPTLCWAQGSEPPELGLLPPSEPLPPAVELKPEAQPLLKSFGTRDLAAAAHHAELELHSAAALVIDQEAGQLLYAKNTDAVMPIASITKLMTAIVVLDAGLPLDDMIVIEREDMDYIKGTRSRLKVGTILTRKQLLRLALMASENRAAAALARSYPGGTQAFVQVMNQKARQLGMRDTHFRDSTGLDPSNVSTAMDLALLVNAGYNYPLIREFSTAESYRLGFEGARRNRMLAFRNSNGLVRSGEWDIGLQKTGYISEAGRCLVMQARIATRPVIIVLLDSWGKFTRIADAKRIKRWMESFQPTINATPRRLRMS